MTTIAYRDGVIAGDTLCVNGHTRSGTMVKIARSPDGALGGSCGTAAYNRMFLAWLARGRTDPRPIPRTDDDNRDYGFVVLPGGMIEQHEPEGVNLISAPFCAAGSGRLVAMGAMAAGASAEEAVKAAILLDCYTGGEITVLRAKEDA